MACPAAARPSQRGVVAWLRPAVSGSTPAGPWGPLLLLLLLGAPTTAGGAPCAVIAVGR